MNNIYNNLTIDNLIKTEWFNQFNKSQQKQILKGLEEDVDVSIYTKTDFNFAQMEEIRLGLGFSLDVSIYAKKEYSSKKMRGIRLSLPKKSTLK